LKRAFLEIKKMPNYDTNTAAITQMEAILPIITARSISMSNTSPNRSDEWKSYLTGTAFFVVLKMVIEFI